MLLSLVAARKYLDTNEYFTSSDTQVTQTAYMIGFIIGMLISAYGAARLSYFYNMSTGNSGYAVFWSVLAFIFSDFYYPVYSFFLNPQSARGRNNIPMPSAM